MSYVQLLHFILAAGALSGCEQHLAKTSVEHSASRNGQHKKYSTHPGTHFAGTEAENRAGAKVSPSLFGMQPNDTLKRIDGEEVSVASPDEALNAYAKFLKRPHVQV